jgi:RNA polymerase sigma-70 factor (family 1)
VQSSRRFSTIVPENSCCLSFKKTHTEPSLFKLIAEGDEGAYRAVFEQYKEVFFAAAFKMIRSSEEAEEIVQEVFIALWTKRTQVAQAQKPEHYLFTILYNTIYDHFRKLAMERKMKKGISTTWEQSEEETAEEILLAKENRALFEEVIGKLPPQQKLVYQLAKQQGLSREEIAKRLDISPNTVKNHLQSATHFIRAYFKHNISAIIWLAIFYSLELHHIGT